MCEGGQREGKLGGGGLGTREFGCLKGGVKEEAEVLMSRVLVKTALLQEPQQQLTQEQSLRTQCGTS